MNVRECGDPINLSASGVALPRAGTLLGIFVASASSTPTIKVWDNTAASGNIVVNTFTPVAGTFYPIPSRVRTGCYISISGTVDCTAFVTC
jgi:hypothetical protein